MIRGTTAQFRFKIPYDFDTLESASVVFWQNGNGGPALDRPLPITKTKMNGDLTTLPGNQRVIIASFTREETLRFVTDRKASIQLIAQTTSGIDFASDEEIVTVYPIADDSIVDDPVIPPSDTPIILDGGLIVNEEAII